MLLMSKNQSRFDAMMTPELKEIVEHAKGLEKWPLARLISLFETNTEQAKQARHSVMSSLKCGSKNGLVLGITGTPGAGKSSLIGELCLSMLTENAELSIAVLAVDPSSQRSGGALLGDRTRTNFPVNDKRLFFRSQASDLDLGGVGKKTFQVTRLLKHLFDIIIIETVGIGQSEIEVEQLSDHTCLVLQPLAGDQVQFMKAGIMEVPDTFIINKCDEDSLAKRSYHLLKTSLKLVNISLNKNSENSKNIFLTSAIKQKGISELTHFLLQLESNSATRKDTQTQEHFYLDKWIQQEFGRFGSTVFKQSESTILNSQQSYEEKENMLFEIMKEMIPSLGS
jgi:LAO/AO transport system ATPase